MKKKNEKERESVVTEKGKNWYQLLQKAMEESDAQCYQGDNVGSRD